MEEVRGSSPLSPTTLHAAAWCCSAVVLFGVIGGQAAAEQDLKKPRAPARLLVDEVSQRPLTEPDVLSWLAGRAPALREALGAQQPKTYYFVEYAKAAGQRDAPKGMELAQAQERIVFVVKVPMIRAGEPWILSSSGQVLINGAPEKITEHREEQDVVEEMLDGKRVVRTKARSVTTARPLKRTAVIAATAVAAPTVTLWVDRFGRVYTASE